MRACQYVLLRLVFHAILRVSQNAFVEMEVISLIALPALRFVELDCAIVHFLHADKIAILVDYSHLLVTRVAIEIVLVQLQ